MNKTLSLYEIARDVAKRADVSTAHAETVIEMAFMRIGQAMMDGDKVKLRGFGTFESDEKRARVKFIVSRRIADYLRRKHIFKTRYGVSASEFKMWKS